jgi:hypothetical protein
LGLTVPAREKLLCVVVLTALATIAAGCSLDSRLSVHFTGTAPLVIDETARSVELDPHHVVGVTTTRREIGITCSVTVTYEANDLGGPGVFTQTRVVRLHTRRVPRGTPYDLDCSGPLIVQLPAGASNVQATAGTASLPVRSAVKSVRLAFHKHLRAPRGTQFVLLGPSETLPGGDYRIDVSFSLGAARTFREKLVYAASVSCGRARYVEPLVPPARTMKRVPALRLTPSKSDATLSLPRIAGTRENGVPVHAARRLSCAR